VCGGTSRRPVLRATCRGQPLWLLRCLRCRLVQPEWLPTAAELRDYYRRYAYDHSESWHVDSATDASLKALAQVLRPYQASGRLLDVGCGAGALLKAMSSEGWRVEGQEISEAAAHRLEKEGFRVHRGILESMEVEDASFDVIVMSEVIEHLSAPHLALGAVHRLLRPGGALYLTTPNLGSLSRWVLRDKWCAIDPPGHLSYFDRGSLRAYLARAELRELRVWSEGLNPYELLGVQHRTPGGVYDVSRARKLRIAAARPGALRVAKRAVNIGLRLTGLGDTLKALVER
jgi:2-polyprenyl-3-methyl-5-hydroxy-6-metoxy-1,4-benzoquinol methylase